MIEKPKRRTDLHGYYGDLGGFETGQERAVGKELVKAAESGSSGRQVGDKLPPLSFQGELPALAAQGGGEPAGARRSRVGVEVEPWVKPADRIVAQFAQKNGGIYAPDRHQRELEGLRQAPSGDRQPTPAERVRANVRRLERLERYRLAKRLADDRWRVPADLLSQLESRERTHPQQRVHFEKVGIPAREPVRPRTPDVASERDALARALSKELRLTYVAEPPAFRGRVMACAPTPAGREFVQVVDCGRGQFTLVSKSAAVGVRDGQMVRLRHDRDRGLVLEIDRGISR